MQHDDAFDDEAPSEEKPLDMDAITAHLDRGWDLLGRGDTMAARVSAHHILQLDGESPEGHTLLGAIMAAEGEPEEAMELFRRALDNEPEYVDALLYAAEIAIHPLADFEQALKFCDEAEELVAEGEEEALDVWLLRAEACIAAGSRGMANRALDALPKPPYPDPAYNLRVGRLCLDLERREQAVALLEQALEQPSSRVDAHYFLGVALEQEGKSLEALAHLFSVHALDKETPRPRWALDDAAFESLFERVLTAVPAPYTEQILGVPHRVEDVPPLELVAEGLDPRAAVFFAGMPPRAEEGDGAARRRRGATPAAAEVSAVLAAIFVYKRNVERFAGSAAAVRGELYRAVVQELSFFFGLDDEGLDELLDAEDQVLGAAGRDS